VKRAFTVAMIVSAFGMFAQQTDAQGQRRVAGRVPVTVALLAKSPYTADAILMRRPGDDQSNIILLSSRAASAEVLSASAVALAAVMEREGDVATKASILALPNDIAGPKSEYKTASRVIMRLSHAPESYVPGVGKARTTVIYLPDAGERARLHRSRRATFNSGR